MAISPKDTYPGQIDETTDPAGYPYGAAQNIDSPGDGTGTPWEEQLVSDIFGMQQSLLDAAGLTPTGTPDKVGASQYLDAVRAVADQQIGPHFNVQGEVVLASSTTAFSIFIPASAGVDEDPGSPGFSSPDAEYKRSEVNSARLIFNISPGVIPSDAILTRVDAIVDPGAARTGSNRMSVNVRLVEFGPPSVPSLNVIDYYQSHGPIATQPTGFQYITPETAMTPADVSELVGVLLVIVQCGNNAGASKDKIYGIKLTGTVSTIQAI